MKSSILASIQCLNSIQCLRVCVCVYTLLLKKVEVTLYVHICGVLVLVRAWSNHAPWSWATWRPCDTHRRAGGASFHGFLPEEGKALRNASISLNASLQVIPNQAHGGRGNHLFHIRKGVCEPTTAFMQMTSRMLGKSWRTPDFPRGPQGRKHVNEGQSQVYPSHKPVWQTALLKLYPPGLGVCIDLNSRTREVRTAGSGALGLPQFHSELKATLGPMRPIS